MSMGLHLYKSIKEGGGAGRVLTHQPCYLGIRGAGVAARQVRVTVTSLVGLFDDGQGAWTPQGGIVPRTRGGCHMRKNAVERDYMAT